MWLEQLLHVINASLSHRTVADANPPLQLWRMGERHCKRPGLDHGGDRLSFGALRATLPSFHGHCRPVWGAHGSREYFKKPFNLSLAAYPTLCLGLAATYQYCDLPISYGDCQIEARQKLGYRAVLLLWHLYMVNSASPLRLASCNEERNAIFSVAEEIICLINSRQRALNFSSKIDERAKIKFASTKMTHNCIHGK